MQARLAYFALIHHETNTKDDYAPVEFNNATGLPVDVLSFSAEEVTNGSGANESHHQYPSVWSSLGSSTSDSVNVSWLGQFAAPLSSALSSKLDDGGASDDPAIMGKPLSSYRINFTAKLPLSAAMTEVKFGNATSDAVKTKALSFLATRSIATSGDVPDNWQVKPRQLLFTAPPHLSDHCPRI